MKDAINIIILHFGYAEDASIATVIAASRICFSTEEAAIKSLANELLIIFKGKLPSKRSCCEFNLENPANNYCSRCGLNLKLDADILPQFRGWLPTLLTMDYDSFGYDEWFEECDYETCWELGLSPMELVGRDRDEIVLIDACADEVLAKAIGYKE